MNKQLHTPEGVRDIYGDEAAQKEQLESSLLSVIRSYGYRRIYTPAMEYFDVFSRDIGSTASNELYKFFDREGNTLVLRPDVTPQIARAAAKLVPGDDEPQRICYCERVFTNPFRLMGRLHECTQIGAEMLGECSVYSDAELIALSCELLTASGLTEFGISIGHIGFFNGLIAACGMNMEQDAEIIEELFGFIRNRNFFGLEEALKRRGIKEEIITLFSAMGRFYNAPEEWEDLLALAKSYPDVEKVLTDLTRLYDVLSMYGVLDHISFDLGLLTSLRYYTGIVFAGYTYGSGESVISGGRYDGLHRYFGGDRPAVGFAIREDELLVALQRQDAFPKPDQQITTITIDPANPADAIARAQSLRREGRIAVIENEAGGGE